jgi:hypothetical protein
VVAENMTNAPEVARGRSSAVRVLRLISERPSISRNKGIVVDEVILFNIKLFYTQL